MKKHTRIVLILAVDSFVLLTVLFARQLVYLITQITPVCAFRHYTGLLCPFCGGTHAAMNLLSGNIAAAFSDNAAVALLAVYGAIALLFGNLYCFTGKAKKLFLRLVSAKAVLTWCAFAVLLCIAKNVAQAQL